MCGRLGSCCTTGAVCAVHVETLWVVLSLFLVILYVLLHVIGRNLDVLCDDYWFFFFWSNINSFIIRVYSPPTDVTTIEASADLATKSASQLFKRGT